VNRWWSAGLGLSVTLVLPACTATELSSAETGEKPESPTSRPAAAGGGEGDDELACAEALGPRRIRRLSHDEFGNSARALVGQEVAPEANLSLDDVVNGYQNDADALVVSSVLASQYRVAAEGLAFVVREDLPQSLPCSQVPNLDANGTEACATTFIEAFGGRAFRRPVSADERDRYLELWRPIAQRHGLDEGLYWVAAAMLQSPNFLYRTELGTWDEARQAHVLTPYEVASQLSYLITAGPPDAELMAAAQAGELSGAGASEALEAHAERLLAGDDGGRAYADFAEAWLGVRRPRVAPDPDVYHTLTDELRDDMRGEYRRYAAHFMTQGRTFEDLMTSRTSWVTQVLAGFYDLPPVLEEVGDPAGFVRTQLPPRRAGLLARGRVLTVYADPAASAPTQRGKMVRERVLCEVLPPPPAEVNTSPIPPNDDQTTRERHAQHTQDASCFKCHKYMDPIGFGFEHFDGIARWRDLDNERPVDATGEIHPGPGGVEGTFDGLGELSTLLGNDDAVAACYVEQWTQFASAAPVDDEASVCLQSTLLEAFEAADGRLDAPVRALVASRWFLERGD